MSGSIAAAAAAVLAAALTLHHAQHARRKVGGCVVCLLTPCSLSCVAQPLHPVSYGSITKVETWPIVGHEQYSIVALQLSSGKYW